MDESGLPIILTPQDISRVLGISRNKCYEIVHSKDFQYRVRRDKFLAWLSQVEEVV